MSHKSREATASFAFQDLTIREMTPDGLTSASVAEVTVPPSAAHARARSTKSDKLYAGQEGEVVFRLDGGEVRLRPGDTLAIPAGSWFAYVNDGERTARLLLVHVPPFDLDAEEFEAPPEPGGGS